MGKSALDTQIGGNHYKNFPIQPIEFIIKNKLSFPQGNVVKRIVRYNLPTGKGIEDLRKIKHEIDLLIELELIELEGLDDDPEENADKYERALSA